MVKIVHYEVYSDSGDGWRLEERFASEQRYEAVNLAKEVEQAHKKVKIIKEFFDVQDNSYQETVEYVSGMVAKKASAGGTPVPGMTMSSKIASASPSEEAQGQTMMTAIVKLVAIIIICLALANFLVSLLVPVVENFVSEDIINPILFIIFFSLFLGIALPLLLKKVPWYVFTSHQNAKPRPVNERKFYNYAEIIARRYNLNDNFDPQIAPVWPEAPVEFKHYIIDFLKDVVANINSTTFLQDSFSKLGVKLVIYGGCLELARYSGLRLSEANSLLFEAFKILDGETTDLEAFYEAKKSYKDNRCALFLTGVGAFLMARIIKELPADNNLLHVAFDKWEAQNLEIAQEKKNADSSETEKEVSFSCQVNLKITIDFMDSAIPGIDSQRTGIKADMRNIIQNLLTKYKSNDVVESGDITSIVFGKLNRAVKFAVDFLKDANIYSDDINDENVIFHCCCNIIEENSEADVSIHDYILDLFEQTYDYEIITTEVINKFRDELDTTKYGFDFLGEKTLSRTRVRTSLYKILY